MRSLSSEVTWVNMQKELALIEEQLGRIVVALRIESLYEANGEYLLNKGSEAADFLLESTESERAFIMHKLCPDLEIVDVYEGNHLIFKLK